MTKPAAFINSLRLLLFCSLFAWQCKKELPDRFHTIKQGGKAFRISLKEYRDKNFSLVSSNDSNGVRTLISEWKLAYPVFHFECADMDGDGTGDIIVGVIKSTRFDSISRKRIFIFKYLFG